MVRHRAEPGMLLPENDPRVQAAARAMMPMLKGEYDWRDVAEVVNAVLAKDDEMELEGLVQIRFTPGSVMEMPPDPKIRHGKLEEGECRVQGWHLLENCADQQRHQINLGGHLQSRDWPDRINTRED